MKRIKLTQNKYALVSDKDFSSLNRFKWYAHFDGCNWYAQRRKPGPRGTSVIIRMHKQILGDIGSLEPDHKDSNGLNNRRNNLRVATHQQNVQNRKIYTSITGYKGVRKYSNKFVAVIGINHTRKRLGYFATAKQAARAYNKAACKYFGRFAKLNII